MKALFQRVLMFCVPALLVPSTLCHADPVDVSVSGHLYGEYSLAANQTFQEAFTLDQATQIGSMAVGIQPDYGSMYYTYEVTLTGPEGTYNVVSASSYDAVAPDQSSTPVPSILPAGSYTWAFIGGPCMGFCSPANNVSVAGIDFYGPPSYTDIGGSVNAGSFGFTLTGESVAPELPSLALLLTGVAGIPARRYLRGLRRVTSSIMP